MLSCTCVSIPVRRHVGGKIGGNGEGQDTSMSGVLVTYVMLSLVSSLIARALALLTNCMGSISCIALCMLELPAVGDDMTRGVTESAIS